MEDVLARIIEAEKIRLRVQPHGTLSLLGVGGSQAYGLATPESDFDYKGFYTAPLETVLSMTGVSRDTIDGNDPDFQVYEVHKFMQLAAKANPTVLETLFLHDFSEIDGVGKILVDNRHLFLSERIRWTHLGYANAQMKRLKERNDGSFKSKLRKRYEKHARHVYRLLLQGAYTLETGDFEVVVRDRDAIMAVGQLEPAELERFMASEFTRLETIETDLPREPDMEALNQILLTIRGI